MNRNIRNDMAKAARIFNLLAVCLGLAACGGGGGDDQVAGIGGTGITVGKITNFGSIFVNGVEYDTAGSTFIVDDNPSASQDDLEIGMVVRLRVETENGELTSKATEVDYDGEIEGPVKNLTAGATQSSFEIFGQPVVIDVNKTIFKGTTFAGIAVDNIVEVSGFRDNLGAINATYVEKKGDLTPGSSEVELRGEVSSYTGGSTFTIGTTVINIDPLNTVIDVPGGVLANGMLVEVKGVIQGDLSINAAKIEFEDDVFVDSLDEVSLQGIISNYVSNSNFEIDGLPINAGTAKITPLGTTLANGLEVEVEGDMVGGVLVADEVGLREGESRVEALVQSGSVNTVTGKFQVYYQSVAGLITIKTDSRTLFKDELSSGALPNLTLGDLDDDDFVRVEGQEIAGELVASIVKRIDDPGPGFREFELEGAVDAFASQNWIQILGIQYPTDGGTETEYEDANENPLTAIVFFGQLGARPNSGVGTLLEIKDDKATYGVADKVEFEN